MTSSVNSSPWVLPLTLFMFLLGVALTVFTRNLVPKRNISPDTLQHKVMVLRGPLEKMFLFEDEKQFYQLQQDSRRKSAVPLGLRKPHLGSAGKTVD